MRTDEAKALIEWFDDRMAMAETLAHTHAVEYARTDEPQAKASFQRQADFHKLYDEIRGKVCTTLLMLERKIPDAGGAK